MCPVCIWLIDEFSMMGSIMMLEVNNVYSKSKTLYHMTFLDILAVGDLYQLLLVLQPMLFELTSNAYAFLYNSGCLWKDCFKLIELTETMHQKDDKRFAELLGWLRTASYTSEDYAALHSRNCTTKPIQEQHFMYLGHAD